MTSDDQDFIPTRQSLLSRLKDWNNDESWRRFFETYWKLIFSTARKCGLTVEESEDVVQEVIVSVAQKIPDFNYDPKVGSFKGWLLKQTRWRAVDHLRKRNRRITQENLAADFNIDPARNSVEPELEEIWAREWEKNLMDAALQRIKQTVDPLHYQVFDYYVIQGLAVGKICNVLRVSRARVYLIKHRVSKLVQREVNRLEKNVM